MVAGSIAKEIPMNVMIGRRVNHMTQLKCLHNGVLTKASGTLRCVINNAPRNLSYVTQTTIRVGLEQCVASGVAMKSADTKKKAVMTKAVMTKVVMTKVVMTEEKVKVKAVMTEEKAKVNGREATKNLLSASWFVVPTLTDLMFVVMSGVI